MKIIRAKMKGKKVRLEEPEPEPADAKIVDLMARLRESLEQGSKGRGTARAAGRGGRKAVASRPVQRVRKRLA
jgi:non-homologous end joining protein Ku